MELSDILALTEYDRRAARNRGIAMFGLGLLGARKGREGEALGRAGLLGVGARDNALYDAQAGKYRDMQMQMLQQKMREEAQAKESAADLQKQIGGVFANPPSPLAAMGQGGPTGQNLAAVQKAAQSDPRIAQYRQVADILMAKGQVEQAAKAAAIADKLEEEYSVDPKVVIADGKPSYAQFSKRGNQKVAQGIAPPPDLQLVDRGGTKEFVDKLTTAPGTSFGVTMTPAQADESKRGWANFGMRQKEFGAAEAARLAGPKPTEVGKLVTDIRKELNALQPVQNFRTALPIAKSAKNAPDTPAGDLDLIYAVGKVLDPNSVVRESELQLVIKSGTPLERFQGYARMIGQGKGRLPPAQRAALMQMLDGRVQQLKTAHDYAAGPYVKQAQALGLPMDQIFQEEAPDDSPLSPEEDAELKRLRQQLGRR